MSAERRTSLLIKFEQLPGPSPALAARICKVELLRIGAFPVSAEFTTIGIDVSKENLDICILTSPAVKGRGQRHRVPNTPLGFEKLIG